jgi:hypothetical protein
MPFLSDLRAMILAGIAALCLLVAGVQTVRLNGLLWFDGALDKVEELRRDNNELRGVIAEADRRSREREAEVERIIRQGKVNRGKADDKAKRIENAPLPGDCRTPDSILNLDI